MHILFLTKIPTPHTLQQDIKTISTNCVDFLDELHPNICEELKFFPNMVIE